MKEKIRIVSQKYARDNKVIRVGSKHKGKRVPIDDIIYIEASENYTFLHLKNGNRLLSSKCLKHYENLLTEQGFVRIHRSFLVHLIHIKEYEKKYRLLHLSGNTILSVSYRRKSILSKIINTKEFQNATKQVA